MADNGVDKILRIADFLPDGIAVVTGESVYAYVNHAYEELVGISSDEVIGKKVSHLVEGGILSSPTLTEIIQRTKQPASIIQKMSLTGRELLLSGNPVFDQQGSLLFIVATLRDMTDLNQVRKELEQRTAETRYYRDELARITKSNTAKVFYRSKAMSDIIDLATRVAPFDTTILITGESGVGKEVVARYIHDLSARREGPFVEVNCAAIPEQELVLDPVEFE
jgi:PAS domain S-box-containing protein